MDDGDDHSRSASPSPSPRRHPTALSSPVTIAAPPHQTLTLALPVQTPRPGGAGREDCWSDGATSALIDAWGERFLELSGGHIKQKQWQEVADAVSSREDYTKPPKTDLQCKNRIDTLKKKYKIESTRIASGAAASSPWPFFHRLDLLIGSSTNPPPPSKAAPAPAPTLAPAPASVLAHARRRPPSPSVSDSPAESSDGFPPETANGRKPQGSGTQEVIRAIMRFGEVYERVESLKLQHAMEMEEQRLGFERELAEQRMQFFMKTHMELSRSKHRARVGSSSSKRKRVSGGGAGNNIVSNNHSNNSSS